jgi:hypothetical protein
MRWISFDRGGSKETSTKHQTARRHSMWASRVANLLRRIAIDLLDRWSRMNTICISVNHINLGTVLSFMFELIEKENSFWKAQSFKVCMMFKWLPSAWRARSLWFFKAEASVTLTSSVEGCECFCVDLSNLSLQSLDSNNSAHLFLHFTVFYSLLATLIMSFGRLDIANLLYYNGESRQVLLSSSALSQSRKKSDRSSAQSSTASPSASLWWQVGRTLSQYSGSLWPRCSPRSEVGYPHLPASMRC